VRGDEIGPPAGALSAAALQIFLCARRLALSGAPYVTRRLQRATSVRTHVNIQQLEISPRTLHFPTHEYDIEEEENISILLAYRAVKKQKTGGSMFGRQKFMRSYFNENPIFPKAIFGGVFG
jgi:hypothetical protein